MKRMVLFETPESEIERCRQAARRSTIETAHNYFEKENHEMPKGTEIGDPITPFKEMLKGYDKEFETFIMEGRIADAIDERDMELLTALLLEAGNNEIILSPDLYREIAYYLHSKGKNGRPPRPVRWDTKERKIAECYGQNKAHLCVVGMDNFKNCTEIKHYVCQQYGISHREFDDIISKFKDDKEAAYYIELIKKDQSQEILNKKGLADLEKAKKNYPIYLTLQFG